MYMNKTIHCRRCIEKLAECGELPLIIYYGICEIYSEERIPLLLDVINSDQPKTIDSMLKFLEVKGYIISNDASDIDDELIRVKPMGYHSEENDAHFFCPLNCKGFEI